MNTTDHNHPHHSQVSSGVNSADSSQGESQKAPREGFAFSWPLKSALLMVALVGGFYLLREHWNHVAGNWIYLLLLACPLMHLFHGHGGHGAGHGSHTTSPNKPVNKEE